MGDAAAEAAARAEAAEAERARLCVVCMTAPRDVLFTACGHFLLCDGCAAELLRRGAPCPSCRTPVHAVGGVAPAQHEPGAAAAAAGLAATASYQPGAVEPRALAPLQLRETPWEETLRRLRNGDATLTSLNLFGQYIGAAAATQLAESVPARQRHADEPGSAQQRHR
jgi:hypothetical protein